jgi:hypothetical protein
MKVKISAGKVVHEGRTLKVRTYWGERVAAICGAKGNTGGIVRMGCFEVGDEHQVTCKKCLVILQEQQSVVTK